MGSRKRKLNKASPYPEGSPYLRREDRSLSKDSALWAQAVWSQGPGGDICLSLEIYMAVAMENLKEMEKQLGSPGGKPRKTEKQPRRWEETTRAWIIVCKRPGFKVFQKLSFGFGGQRP